MKLVSLFLLCLVSQGAPSGARLSNGSVGVSGVSVNYQTYLEPGSPSIQRHGGGVLTENNIIKRHLCNFDNRTYFGYDLTIEPLTDGRFKLRFAALTISPAKMSEIFQQVPNWSPLPLPGGEATLVMKAGDTVALELFTNPSTGQKVTEYLVVKGGDQHEVRVEGQARDFGARRCPDCALRSPGEYRRQGHVFHRGGHFGCGRLGRHPRPWTLRLLPSAPAGNRHAKDGGGARHFSLLALWRA